MSDNSFIDDLRNNTQMSEGYYTSSMCFSSSIDNIKNLMEYNSLMGLGDVSYSLVSQSNEISTYFRGRGFTIESSSLDNNILTFSWE